MEQEIFKLNIHEARMIRQLKRRFMFKRLTEVYFPPEDPNFGNEIAGIGLVKAAAKVLNIDITKTYTIGDDVQFDADNLSYAKLYGLDIFWWEM